MIDLSMSYESLVQKARELGGMIATHPRFKAVLASEQEVTSDQETMQLLQQHEQMLMALHEKETKMQPVEVSEKHALQAMQERMAHNPKVQKLLKAQMEYSEMMQRINETIDSQLRPDSKE